jgi:glucose-1-phosphate thymidylyltransferase
MNETLKIVIPTAGLATRMRPQTWSKPKPLVSVAGRTVLDHLLDSFHSIPGRNSAGTESTAVKMTSVSGQPANQAEYILILGPGLGEAQIPAYMQEHYPQLTTRFVVQQVMKGQSDALWLARQYLAGPTLVCFSDTLIETDFSFLAVEKADGVAWVKSVTDPRRFGVAEMDSNGWVTQLIEKPEKTDNHLVVVGCYYFKQAEGLLSAIEEQIRRGNARHGEFFLADTINIMIERGLKMRPQVVEVWLDTGTIEATLETNRYLLEHGKANHNRDEQIADSRIVPPAFVHPTAKITNSVIGPYASIAADCTIKSARIEDSILEAGGTVETAALKGSFLGRQALVQGRSADEPPLTLNIGDNSSICLR